MALSKEKAKELVDHLVADTACCDRTSCRCWQAVSDLKSIMDYCDAEINLSPHDDLKKYRLSTALDLLERAKPFVTEFGNGEQWLADLAAFRKEGGG